MTTDLRSGSRACSVSSGPDTAVARAESTACPDAGCIPTVTPARMNVTAHAAMRPRMLTSYERPLGKEEGVLDAEVVRHGGTRGPRRVFALNRNQLKRPHRAWMFVPVEHRPRRRQWIAVVGPQPFRID